jgi:predicted metal-dependent hydrolase
VVPVTKNTMSGIEKTQAWLKKNSSPIIKTQAWIKKMSSPIKKTQAWIKTISSRIKIWKSKRRLCAPAQEKYYEPNRKDPNNLFLNSKGAILIDFFKKKILYNL